MGIDLFFSSCHPKGPHFDLVPEALGIALDRFYRHLGARPSEPTLAAVAERARYGGWDAVATSSEEVLSALGRRRVRRAAELGLDVVELARRVFRSGVPLLETLTAEELWALWKFSVGDDIEGAHGRSHPDYDTAYCDWSHSWAVMNWMEAGAMRAAPLWRNIILGRSERHWLGLPEEGDPDAASMSFFDPRAEHYARWLDARGRGPGAAVVREIASARAASAMLSSRLDSLAVRIDNPQLRLQPYGSSVGFLTLDECRFLATEVAALRRDLRDADVDEDTRTSIEFAFELTLPAFEFAVEAGTGMVSLVI